MALDLESESKLGSSKIDQIGISTLDMRHLPAGHETVTLSSRNISYGRKNGRKNHGECRTLFLFGEAEKGNHKEVGSFLRRIFGIEDESPSVSFHILYVSHVEI